MLVGAVPGSTRQNLCAEQLAACAALAALAACSRAPAPPPPGTADDLAAYITRLAAGDPDAAARELARWPLDRALWQRTVVEPYRARWDELSPAPRLAAIATQLRPGTVTARRHYADDPRLTPGQLWQRWALPPLYPSFVVELGGRPLDTVFLHDGARWRALAGLDDLIDARVRALDPGCAAHLAAATGSAACADAAWAVADAALRAGDPGDPANPGAPAGTTGTAHRDHFARTCHLAANLCGKRSP
jgi:hypothetical protein